MSIYSKEVQLMKLTNRLNLMESRGNLITDCGVMRKVIRQRNKLIDQ